MATMPTMAALAISNPDPEAMITSLSNGMKRKRLSLQNGHNPKRVRAGNMDIDSASEEDDSQEVMEDDLDILVETPPTPISRPSSARPKKYTCTHTACNKAYARPKALAEHIRSHTNERPFKCTEAACSKTFRREDHVRRHVQIAHKNERNHVCPWEGCDKRFCDSAKLKTHIAVHEGRERFKCTGYEGCTEWFRKRETLRAHITTVHLGQKPYPCDYSDEITGEKCEHGYATALKLAEHKRRAHEPTRYNCQICQKENRENDGSVDLLVFPNFSSLQTHIKIVHPPTCKFCSRTFVSAKSLTQHIELAHSSSDTLDARRTFHCTHPGCHGTISYGFTRRSNLNAHVRQVHEGIRPFICGQTDLSKSKKCSVDGKPWDGGGACGKACQTKHHLEEHVRTAHLGLEWTQVAKKREKKAAAGLPADARRRARPSALMQLTGQDYDREAGRDIQCVVDSCAFRFFREYDLRLHCQSMHGLAEVEYVDALREKESHFADLFEGMFYDDDDDEEIERALDEEMGVPFVDKVDVKTGMLRAAPRRSRNRSLEPVPEDEDSMLTWFGREQSCDEMDAREVGDMESHFAIDPMLQAHDQTYGLEEADMIMGEMQ